MKLTRKSISLWIKLLITIGLMVYIFSIIPLSQVVKATKQTDIVFFMISFLIMLIARLVDAFQFQLLTRGQGLTFKFSQILEINFITSFYGQVLPGYIAGGALRWYRLAKYEKKPVHILTAILFNRALEVGIIAGMGLILWFTAVHPSKNTIHAYFFVLIILAMFTGFILMSLDFVRFRNKFTRVPILNKDIFWNILKSLKGFSKYGTYLKCQIIAIGFLKHTLSLFAFYYLAKGLDLKISFPDLSFMRSFLSLLMYLPISFSGIGIRDVTLVHLFDPYGVAPAIAITLAFLVLVRSFLISLIGGVLELRYTFTQR